MAVVRRVVAVGLGVVLIVLGLAGWHVELGAVIVGSIAVGLTSGDWIVELVDAARGYRRDGPPTVGEAPDRRRDDPPAAPPPTAGAS